MICVALHFVIDVFGAIDTPTKIQAFVISSMMKHENLLHTQTNPTLLVSMPRLQLRARECMRISSIGGDSTGYYLRYNATSARIGD